MKLQQLSLFLENRPGRLGAPLEAIAAQGINLMTLSLADTAQFGILRLIVREWEQARQVLEKAGWVSISPRWWRWTYSTAPGVSPRH